MTSHINSGT
jgi:hypothetical protein